MFYVQFNVLNVYLHVTATSVMAFRFPLSAFRKFQFQFQSMLVLRDNLFVIRCNDIIAIYIDKGALSSFRFKASNHVSVYKKSIIYYILVGSL